MPSKFTDVTLACEDNKVDLEVHRVILTPQGDRMAPNEGNTIVNTVLALIRARKDEGKILTKDWKDEVIKEFGLKDLLEARNIMIESLELQGKGDRKKANIALDDIIDWFQESETSAPDLQVACNSAHLQKVAAFMLRTQDLGPAAVVSLSARMGLMEENMRALTAGINSFKKEVQKEQIGAGENSFPSGQLTKDTRSRAGAGAPSFASIQQQQKEQEIQSKTAPAIILQPPEQESTDPGWNTVTRRGFRGVSPKRSAAQMEGAGAGGAGGKTRGGAPSGGKSGRKKTPASFGSAVIDIEGVEAAPVDFFVGNTTPKIDNDKVKEIILKCAALKLEGKPENIELKLEDVNVKCLNNIKDEPNPRTKCWRITVPHVWREVMKRDEFYPRGWSHRAFHHSRGGGARSEQNKRLRPDSEVTEQPAM